VSLRYLFNTSEDKETLPTSDVVTTSKVTEGTTTEVGGRAGVSGAAGVTPSLEVHVQRQHSISVQREMKT